MTDDTLHSPLGNHAHDALREQYPVNRGLDSRFSKVDQVVAWLNERITMRYYAPGARVPSVRQLADKLSVSRFTVVNAYDKLVASGVLVSRVGSGFYVAELVNTLKKNAAEKNAPNAISAAQVDTSWLLHHIFSDVSEEHSPGSGLLPNDWLVNERVGVAVRSVTKSCESHIYGYGHVQGYLPLREQMVVQLHQIGMVATPEQMVCTQGVSSAIDLMARYMLKSGDTVLVDDPSWFWLYGSLQAKGLRVIGVPRDEEGPNIEVLSRVVAHDKPKVYVTNSVLHNPTSFGLSPARAYQVLRLMDEHDCYILEDDIYGDFHSGVAKGAPALRYAALDQFKRVFYVAGFSKSLAAGLRVAVVCCPPVHVKGFISQKMLSSLSSPEINEAVVHRLLVDGQHRRHLEKLRLKIANAHERLRDALPKIGLRYPPETQNGLFVWVDTGVDTNAMALAAMSDGWLVAPGGLFSPSQGVSTHMRLNVARTSDVFLQWLGDYVAYHQG
ncbi:GntR family transcriptional regulator [Formosimonas limnophila]|uniref:GntR family transcriptional regulator n=1 Tax=Formosimonas limnophila TaxID=1384487 RepID=A0A8J3CG97_9BURK|nr:PLP-dependent aminotransferase family protein [Formosimonas limnophila]GHA69028.1 GntR family transcriptional regulator [Formosimonas limnophila]